MGKRRFVYCPVCEEGIARLQEDGLTYKCIDCLAEFTVIKKEQGPDEIKIIKTFDL